jgi:galactosyltransferase
MKVCIAIKACRTRRDCALRSKQRESWATQSSIPVLWFVGNGETVTDDVIHLDCDDTYNKLIDKTRAMVKYVLDNDYDYAFFTDTDTFICVDKLLASGFEAHDYIGWCRGRDYAQGGSGYWLSRKAMTALIDDTTPTTHTIWEDMHVGHVLARHGITPHHDERYLVGPANVHMDWPTKGNAIITLHKLTVETMEKVWQRYKQ